MCENLSINPIKSELVTSIVPSIHLFIGSFFLAYQQMIRAE